MKQIILFRDYYMEYKWIDLSFMIIILIVWFLTGVFSHPAEEYRNVRGREEPERTDPPIER